MRLSRHVLLVAGVAFVATISQVNFAALNALDAAGKLDTLAVVAFLIGRYIGTFAMWGLIWAAAYGIFAACRAVVRMGSKGISPIEIMPTRR